MALEVGHIFARLDAIFDDSGFRRYDQAMQKARGNTSGLTETQQKQARQLRTTGASYKEIAQQMGVADRQVRRLMEDTNRQSRSMGTTARANRHASDSARVFASSNGRLGISLRETTKWAIGAVAAYGGLSVLKNAITDTTDLAHGTIALNKNLGISVKTASEFSAVYKARGGDVSQLGMAFDTLFGQVDKANQGSSTSVANFDRLGISSKELKRNSPEQTLFAVADGLGKMGQGFERTSVLRTLFGRGAQKLSPMLRDGSAALKEQLQNAQSLGATFDELGLHKMEDVITAERNMKLAQTGLQISFTQALAPAITATSGELAKFARIMNDPKLSHDQKIHAMTKELGHLEDGAINAIDTALPKIAEHAGKDGGKIALALVKGFIHADGWGKLAFGAFLLTKLGGTKALFSLGAKAGGRWIAGFLGAQGFARLAALLGGGVLPGGRRAPSTVAQSPYGGPVPVPTGKPSKGGKLGGGLLKLGGAFLGYDFLHSSAMQIPALSQYSGTKGFGELGHDIGHDFSKVFGGGSGNKMNDAINKEIAKQNQEKWNDIVMTTRKGVAGTTKELAKLSPLTRKQLSRLPQIAGDAMNQATARTIKQGHRMSAGAAGAAADAQKGVRREMNKIPAAAGNAVDKAARATQRKGKGVSDAATSSGQAATTGFIGQIEKMNPGAISILSTLQKNVAGVLGRFDVKFVPFILGQGASAGSAAVAGAHKKQRGGGIDPRYLGGGHLPGKRVGDVNHALLEDDEFVMNRNAVRGWGAGLLARMNDRFPRFAKGGLHRTNVSGSPAIERDALQNIADRSYTTAGAFIKAHKPKPSAGAPQGAVVKGHGSVGGHPELQPGVSAVVATVLSRYPGLSITSTTGGGHATNSLHYSGRAADLAGGNMDPIGAWIAAHMTGQLTEGIHNPTLSVKDRANVSPSLWGSAVWAEHVNHIHLGVQRGGRIKGYGKGGPVWGAAWVKPKDPSHWTVNEVATLISQAGGSGQAARELSSVLIGESGGNPHAHGPPDGRGLLQVDVTQHPEDAHLDLYNPYVNIPAALKIYNEQGISGWYGARGAAGRIDKSLVATGRKGSPASGKKSKGKKKGKAPGATGAAGGAAGDSSLPDLTSFAAALGIDPARLAHVRTLPDAHGDVASWDRLVPALTGIDAELKGLRGSEIAAQGKIDLLGGDAHQQKIDKQKSVIDKRVAKHVKKLQAKHAGKQAIAKVKKKGKKQSAALSAADQAAQDQAQAALDALQAQFDEKQRYGEVLAGVASEVQSNITSRANVSRLQAPVFDAFDFSRGDRVDLATQSALAAAQQLQAAQQVPPPMAPAPVEIETHIHGGHSQFVTKVEHVVDKKLHSAVRKAGIGRPAGKKASFKARHR